MSYQKRQPSKAVLQETVQLLESFVVENFQDIVIKHVKIDPELQIQKFMQIISQINQEPHLDAFQYVAGFLKHNNTMIRSLTAKFICLICYQNISMQKKLKEMISSSFIVDHILIFNFPDTYNDSQIRVLKRECRKTNAGKKDIVFWYFPLIITPEQESKEPTDDLVEEFKEMILEPRKQFLGFKTELLDPGSNSQTLSKSPVRQIVEKKPTYTRPTARLKPEAREKLQTTPPPKHPENKVKDISPNKTEKASTIQSTPDENLNKHQRHLTMGARSRSDSPREGSDHKLTAFKTGTPKFQPILTSHFRSNGSADYIQPHADNKYILDTEGNEEHDSILPPLSATSNTMTQSHKPDYFKRPNGKSSSGRLKDFLEHKTNETPSTLLYTSRRDETPERIPNFLTENKRGAYTARSLTKSPEKRRLSTQVSIDQKILDHNMSNNNLTATEAEWKSPLLAKRQYKSVLTLEVERILEKKSYSVLAKYLEDVKNKPFPKEKFLESSCDPARKKPNLPDDDELDRIAVQEYIKGNTRQIERHKPDGISSRAYNSYRWKNHIAKLQVANFRPSEDSYHLIQSSTQYGRRRPTGTPNKQKLNVLDDEAKKVIRDLELDVDADHDTYVENLEKGFNMHQVVYGEKFEKYMDVLQFEKSNFGGGDERHIREAYGIVDWLYSMKEKKEEEIIEKLETSAEKKEREDLGNKEEIKVPRSRLSKKKLNENEQDDLFPVPRKQAPRTNLILKKQIKTEESPGPGRRSARKKAFLNP